MPAHRKRAREQEDPIRVLDSLSQKPMKRENIPVHVSQLTAQLLDLRRITLRSRNKRYNERLHPSMHDKHRRRFHDKRVPPVTCLTHDAQLTNIREMMADDSVLNMCLDQIVGALNVSNSFAHECLRYLGQSESAKNITDVLQNMFPLMDSYFSQTCRNFLHWYVALGSVPYCFISCEVFMRGERNYNTLPQHYETYQHRACQRMRQTENATRMRLFDMMALEGSYKGLLPDAKFLKDMGVPSVEAHVVADLAEDVKLDKLNSYRFVLLLRTITKGLVPYVPVFYGGNDTAVVYDRTLQMCMACDSELTSYDVCVENYPSANRFPESLARCNIDRSRQYVRITRSLMATIKESSTRVAVVSIQPPPVKEHPLPTPQSVANSALMNPFSTVAELRQEHERSTHRDLVMQLLTRNNSANPGSAVEAANDYSALLKVMTQHDTEGFVRNMLNGQDAVAHCVLLCEALRHVRDKQYAPARAAVDKLPDELRRLVYLAIDRNMSEAQADPYPCDVDQVRIVQTADYSKLLCQFTNHNPSDLLNDTLHGWSAFWTSHLTGVMSFKHKTSIEYSNNKTGRWTAWWRPRLTYQTCGILCWPSRASAYPHTSGSLSSARWKTLLR